MILSGTHGTCRSNAEGIVASGFTKVTETGRAGAGVYFWSYYDYQKLARKLAVLWWENATKHGTYTKCDKQTCSVIYAQIEVDDSAYLDCNEPSVEAAIYFAIDQALQAPASKGQLTQEMLHKIYEYVISDLERLLSCTFDVIRARVSPPKGDLVEKVAIGNPNCYVVRNGLDKIKVLDVEHID